MLFIFQFSCLFTFRKHKQCLFTLKKNAKRASNGYQMKGLGLGSKNMLFIFQYLCLFTFRKQKQRFVYILKKCQKVISMGN
jgi:hypothetical protein